VKPALLKRWCGTATCALLLCALIAIGGVTLARAQEIRLYSEFERFDPYGNPVASDRDIIPREILSPAMARNGHLSLHIVITGPAGTNYLLYTGANPPDILKIKLYREYFSSCGDDYCPDWLTEQNSPSFGAIPEFRHDLSRPAMDRQTTRSYLLDIWAPPGTPPRRVRVEALLKAGTWFVAPMEVRIVAPVVPNAMPNAGSQVFEENVAPLDAPSSATAEIQLLRYLTGLPIQSPKQILRVRDVIQRNAAEDMLLARQLAPNEGSWSRPFPALNLLSWWPFVYPQLGAEWYLKVRDFLYQFGN
jgi:hypothetical protein